MGDLKTNRNRKKLTPEDAEKGKNFQQVLTGYAAKQNPFYKTTKFYLSVVAVGVVIAVGTVLVVNNNTPTPLADTSEQRPFIDPAVQGLHINDTTFALDAANGGHFDYFNGSQIDVPEGAFLDKNGKPVTGKVELHYREFHDPADIMLAGIPMTYDSAGQRRHFESAGMIELTAWKDGQPLEVNPAMPIRVNMVSHTDEDKFNVYYLDTAKKNWEYIKHDEAKIMAIKSDSAQHAVDSLVANALGTEPLKPKKADPKHPSFNIDVDPAEFPELALYKGVHFEVDENKTPYDPALKNVQWEDAAIVKNPDKSYSVTFTKDNESHTFVTHVVFDAPDYAAAMKQYESRYAAYKQAQKLRKATESGKQAKLEKELKKMDSDRIAANLAALQQAMANRSNYTSTSEDVVYRVFIIEKFGIWNSDYPCALPNGVELSIKLKNGATDNDISAAHIYLVEKSRNAIFTYYASDLPRFRYNPNAENLLWCVTGDNRIAVFKPDEFERIDTTKKEVTLKLHVTDKKFTSTAEAKAFLNI